MDDAILLNLCLCIGNTPSLVPAKAFALVEFISSIKPQTLPLIYLDRFFR